MASSFWFDLPFLEGACTSVQRGAERILQHHTCKTSSGGMPGALGNRVIPAKFFEVAEELT
jgi:hypothetical protein